MKTITKALISSLILIPTTTVGIVSFYIQPSLVEEHEIEEVQLPTVSKINVEKINHNSMLITTDFFEVEDEEQKNEGIIEKTISLYDTSNFLVGKETLEVGKEHVFTDLKSGMEYYVEVIIDYEEESIEDINIRETAITEKTYNWYNRMNEHIYQEIESVCIPTEFWDNDYQDKSSANGYPNAWDDSEDSELSLEHFFGALVETQNITSEAFLTPEGKSTGNIDKDNLGEIIVEFQVPNFTTYELPIKPLENDIWFHNRSSKYGIILETAGTHYDSISQESTEWEHTISFGDISSTTPAKGEWVLKPIYPWVDAEEKIITNSSDRWVWEMNPFNNPEYYEVDFSHITKTFKENLTNLDENGDYKVTPTNSFSENEDGWFASILLKGFNYPLPNGRDSGLVYNPMDDLFSIVPLKRLEVPLKDEEGTESTFIIEPFANKNYKTTFETSFMSWKVSGDEIDQISYRQFVSEDTGELDNSKNKIIGDITLLPDNATEIEWNHDSSHKTIGIVFLTWASVTTTILIIVLGYKKYDIHKPKKVSKTKTKDQKNDK